MSIANDSNLHQSSHLSTSQIDENYSSTYGYLLHSHLNESHKLNTIDVSSSQG